MIKNFIYIIVLIVLLLLLPNKFEAFNHELIFILSIIYIFLVVYFLIIQRKIFKNWVRFDVLFLVAYFIVHFQIPFLASIGFEPERPDFIWINIQVVNFATWMSVFAINLWMLGYSLRIENNNKINLKSNFNIIKINATKFDFLLLISFVIFLSLVGSSLFQGVYDGGNSWGEGANYAFLILRALLYLRIIYFFKEIPQNSGVKYIIKQVFNNKIFTSIVIVFILLFLLSGDRGPVMYIALCIAGSYAIFVKPISFKRFIAFSFLFALVFTVIRFGRGRDASQFDNGNIFERGYTEFQNNIESTNITDELASSVRIQYRALDVVPDQHPYLNGLTFITVGVGVIPFGGSLLINSFDIPKIYAGSAMFFTVIGQGPNPSYGEGSEILGDIYINFGLYGTFLIMFFFGVFSAIVTNRAYNYEIKFIIIFIVLLLSAISMNRGMLFTPLKDIVYVLFLNYLLTRFLK